MTGTCDVTTCADIVYGKHFRTQISLVSAKNDFPVLPSGGLGSEVLCVWLGHVTQWWSGV